MGVIDKLGGVRPKGWVPHWIENAIKEKLWIRADLHEGINKFTVHFMPHIHIPKDPFNDGSEIAYWKLDGNTQDEHGNYHGVWKRGGDYNNQTFGYMSIEQEFSLYTTGICGKAAIFTNMRYIETPLQSINTGVCSISMWVRFAGYSNVNNFLFHFSKDGENIFAMDIDQATPMKPKLFIDGTGYECDDGIVDNRWHHIVATSTGKVFYDGKLRHDFGVNADMTTINRNFIIGADWDSSSINDYFIGFICSVRVFNKELTQGEANWLYEKEGKFLDYGNGRQVFFFFDDFNGDDIDFNIWNKDPNLNYTIKDSLFTPTNNNAIFKNLEVRLQNGYEVRTKVKINNMSVSAYSGTLVHILSDEYTAGDNNNSTACAFCMQRNSANVDTISVFIADGCDTAYDKTDHTDYGILLNQWQEWSALVSGDTIQYTRWGRTPVGMSYKGFSWCKDMQYVRLGYFSRNNSASAYKTTSYDWVYVIEYPQQPLTISYSSPKPIPLYTLQGVYGLMVEVWVENNTGQCLYNQPIPLNMSKFIHDHRLLVKKVK